MLYDQQITVTHDAATGIHDLPLGRPASDDGLCGCCFINALAENAIRPFAVGRRAWLFADTPHGARASATCYSLVEAAEANKLAPYAYLQHMSAHIAAADTVEKLEALLSWNMQVED